MRGLLVAVGVVAAILIVLGLVVEAVKWLLILGIIALVVAVVMGVVEARRVSRQL
jgi:hypothetical protein